MKKIEIKENDSKQTLIKFLQKYFKGAPKSLIQKFIRLKRIKVNGKKQDSSYSLEEGDIVDIYIYDEVIDEWRNSASENSVKSKLNLDIAFENDDVVIIDKPADILSHAASSEDYGKTVVDFLISYLIDKGDYVPRLEQSFRPAIVNRLDRNTKGLIIGAKNRNSLLALNEAIDIDLVEKHYLAIVEGKFTGKKEIVNYLSKDDNNVVHVNHEGIGKKSVTLIKSLEAGSEYSLVEIKLLTGRTHQIRASLKELGHPIVGDRKYFNRQFRIKGVNSQQLLAYKLAFSKNIEIESLRGLEVVSKYQEELISTFNKL